jgi:hypothetical protein
MPSIVSLICDDAMTKLLALAALLTGCATHFTAASTNPGMRFVEWRTSEDLRECRPLRDVAGCAVWNETTCTIYTLPMTSHEILGHELRHCFEGNYHK